MIFRSASTIIRRLAIHLLNSKKFKTMAQHIYLIAIVKNGEEKIDDFQAYSSREKAEKWIFDSAKEYPDRKVEKDKTMTCDYIVSDDKGNYIHTLRIKKIWLR